MPVLAFVQQRQYGTRLSVATTPAHPLSCFSTRKSGGRASGYALRTETVILPTDVGLTYVEA